MSESSTAASEVKAPHRRSIYAYAGKYSLHISGQRDDLASAGLPDEWFEGVIKRPGQRWGRRAFVLPNGECATVKWNPNSGFTEIEIGTNKMPAPPWAAELARNEKEGAEKRQAIKTAFYGVAQDLDYHDPFREFMARATGYADGFKAVER